jgi:hypothetical protein
MDLADPDLPPGVQAPLLRRDRPPGLDAAPYPALRNAFNALPRRSRVVLALRMPPPDRPPLTLRAIGRHLGIGHERVRQIEARAVSDLCVAWRWQETRGLLGRRKDALLAPIISVTTDRYPLDDPEPDERQ